MSTFVIKIRKNMDNLNEVLDAVSPEIEVLEIHSSIHKSINLSKYHWEKLKSLSLVTENLEEIILTDSQFDRLKILKIRGVFQSIKLPDKSDSLEVLQIKGKLKQLDDLKLLNLKNLDLSHNQLEGLEFNQKSIAHLMRVNLDGNNLKSVPDFIWNSKKLLHLSLDENPLTESEKQRLFDKFKIWF